MVTDNMRAFGLAVIANQKRLKEEEPGLSETVRAIMSINEAGELFPLDDEETKEVRKLIVGSRLEELVRVPEFGSQESESPK